MNKILLAVLLCTLYACASIKQPSPPPDTSKTVQVMNAFPEVMPKGSSRFEESQLFFVHADQASELAIGLLVPVPFVTDAVVDAHKKSVATKLEEQYHALSTHHLAEKAIASNPEFQLGDDGYQLYPMVFIEECLDEVYRLTLVYQLEKGDWFDRYHYHLPTMIPKDKISEPGADLLKSIVSDIESGSDTLLAIINSDINQSFNTEATTATVGSLYIVGSKLSGLTSPNIITFKKSKILEETSNSIVVEIAGAPKGEATSGGMAFGIHYFDKNQLHTFKKDD